MATNTKNPEWSAQEKQWLIDLYPNNTNEYIASFVGRSVSAVEKKAMRMGLKKSEKFYRSAKSGRIQPTPKTFFGKLFAWLSLPFTSKKVMV